MGGEGEGDPVYAAGGVSKLTICSGGFPMALWETGDRRLGENRVRSYWGELAHLRRQVRKSGESPILPC